MIRLHAPMNLLIWSGGFFVLVVLVKFLRFSADLWTEIDIFFCFCFSSKFLEASTLWLVVWKISTKMITDHCENSCGFWKKKVWMVLERSAEEVVCHMENWSLSITLSIIFYLNWFVQFVYTLSWSARCLKITTKSHHLTTKRTKKFPKKKLKKT